MQTYFEKDYIVIVYDEANHIVISKWTVSPASEEFREGMEAIISAMEHFKTGKLVSDTTDFGAITKTDRQWASTDWFDRALKTGYSHMAIILPPSIFTRFYMKNMMNGHIDDMISTGYNVFTRLYIENIVSIQQVENMISTGYFDMTQAAINWIKQQQSA